jgi:hypothetical protein
MNLIRKVLSEFSGKAGFHTRCVEQDYAAVIQSAARRIWIQEQLADRHFTDVPSEDYERVLKVAKDIVKQAFEDHPNFVWWADF